jgi:hypothetical protein
MNSGDVICRNAAVARRETSGWPAHRMLIRAIRTRSIRSRLETVDMLAPL